MNFLKHTEARSRRHHRQEPTARGVRALWRLVQRPLLLSMRFAVLMVALADAGISHAAQPIAEIKSQLGHRAHVGDRVPLARLPMNASRLFALPRSHAKLVTRVPDPTG